MEYCYCNIVSDDPNMNDDEDGNNDNNNTGNNDDNAVTKLSWD